MVTGSAAEQRDIPAAQVTEGSMSFIGLQGKHLPKPPLSQETAFLCLNFIFCLTLCLTPVRFGKIRQGTENCSSPCRKGSLSDMRLPTPPLSPPLNPVPH